MEFLIFCSEHKHSNLGDVLGVHAKRLNASVKNVSDLPHHTSMHQILCLCLKSLELPELWPLTQTSYQYLAFIQGHRCTENPIVIRTGGNFFHAQELEDDMQNITNNLRAVIENMKLKDLAYHLSLKELTLIRRIYGLVEADKKQLAQEIYGASSETTLDVNLARLRKKLADPMAGEDFFRIVTKKRKLYLVSVLNDYDESEFIKVFS